MNIGEAANASGVSAKMVRHYEAIGLIDAVNRSASGYRVYSEREVHTLRFIKRGRSLGFSIEEIGKLLTLWQNKKRPSAEVKKLALYHVEELQTKIRNMQEMLDTLTMLAHDCKGDLRPDCPILGYLTSSTGIAKG